MPTAEPSAVPSDVPSDVPSGMPTAEPSAEPSAVPSEVPSGMPSVVPSEMPSVVPVTSSPSWLPTKWSGGTTALTTQQPTSEPTKLSLDLTWSTGGKEAKQLVEGSEPSSFWVTSSQPAKLDCKAEPADATHLWCGTTSRSAAAQSWAAGMVWAADAAKISKAPGCSMELNGAKLRRKVLIQLFRSDNNNQPQTRTVTITCTSGLSFASTLLVNVTHEVVPAFGRVRTRALPREGNTRNSTADDPVPRSMGSKSKWLITNNIIDKSEQ